MARGIGVKGQVGGGQHVRFVASAMAGLLLLGWFGSGGGEFCIPAGVAVDAAGSLYVLDTENNRIQKFVRRHVTTAGRIDEAGPRVHGCHSQGEASCENRAAMARPVGDPAEARR